MRGSLVLSVSVELRDFEELLVEHGVVVSYGTVGRSCEKFGAGFAHMTRD